MKNTKELQAILTSIFCLNRISENEDKDITLILDYAFRQFFGANTNLLILTCLANKDDVKRQVFELLSSETKFDDYKNNKI